MRANVPCVHNVSVALWQVSRSSEPCRHVTGILRRVVLRQVTSDTGASRAFVNVVTWQVAHVCVAWSPTSANTLLRLNVTPVHCVSAALWQVSRAVGEPGRGMVWLGGRVVLRRG